MRPIPGDRIHAFRPVRSDPPLLRPTPGGDAPPLELADDGTVWVLDSAAPFFVGFDQDGEVVSSMGSQGEGPQEFQAPVALVRPRSTDPEVEGIWTYDRMRHAMTRIVGGEPHAVTEPEGTVVPFDQNEVAPLTLLSDEGGIPQPVEWVRELGDGVLVAQGPDTLPDGLRWWRADLVTLSLTDGAIHRHWNMEEHLADPADHHPEADVFLPVPLWATCPDGGAWMYDPADNAVRALPDPAGAADAERRHVALPPERRAVLTADRLFAMLAPRMMEEAPAGQRPTDEELRLMFEGEVVPMLDEFAEVFPEYYTMRCSADGALWLQEFDVEEGHGGAGWTWLRVLDPATGGSADDPELERVRFPEGFTPMRFTEDRAWGIARDEVDVPWVARADIQ